jgi:hypothetical protein
VSPTTQAFVAGFALAAVMGVGWGLHKDAKAARERIAHEQRLADDSTERAALAKRNHDQGTRIAALQADTGRLSLALRRTRAAVPRSVGTVRPILAAADSATGRTEHVEALNAILAAGAACEESLQNCERRSALADSMTADLQRQLDATAKLLDSTATKWRDAESRAQPSLFRDLWRSKSVLVLLAVLLIVTR